MGADCRNFKELIPSVRRKELQIRKRSGWWVEFNESTEQYRMMKNSVSYVVITKDEHDYFRNCNVTAYLPEIAKLNTSHYEHISTAWSEYILLERILHGLKWAIRNFDNRQADYKDYLIDHCIVYGIVRNRIALLKPRQGQKGTWKQFLKLES